MTKTSQRTSVELHTQKDLESQSLISVIKTAWVGRNVSILGKAACLACPFVMAITGAAMWIACDGSSSSDCHAVKITGQVLTGVGFTIVAVGYRQFSLAG